VTDVARSLVIPMRNEARRVPALVDALAAWTATGGREALLVDDGSADATTAEVERAIAGRAGLRALRLDPNQGKGGAVRAGLLAARGALRAFTDADLPYGLDAVDALFEALASADVATGARDLARSDVSRAPALRRVVSRAFRLWVGLVADLGEVRDSQCGVKAFRAEVVPTLFEALERRDFAFDIEVLSLARRLGLRVARVPVRQREEDGSTVRLGTDAPRLFVAALSAGRSARRRTRGP
jgi:glycosyltransferase involved in cell wall biosynthesis